MNMRDLIPRGRNGSQTPSVYLGGDQNPFLSLHREVNRLFDDVSRTFGTRFPSLGKLSPFHGGWPKVRFRNRIPSFASPPRSLAWKRRTSKSCSTTTC